MSDEGKIEMVRHFENLDAALAALESAGFRKSQKRWFKARDLLADIVACHGGVVAVYVWAR